MNKIFKTKYDITTGQTKAVSELANNRQVASRVEAAGSQPKCGVFFGGMLGAFKVLPLALVMSGLLSSVGQAADVWLLSKDDLNKNGNGGLHEGTGIMYDQGKWGYQHNINDGDIKSKESTLLTSGRNRTGAETQLRNKDFWRTVAIGSRAVVGGNDTTAIGYKAIVGINSKETKNRKEDSHQGTAVGYRAFSYGLESVSLGNDTVAYGASSISIGSDNVGQSKSDTGTINNPYSQKALSYDIWDLFHTHGSKFNYTSEYAATKNYSQNNGDKKTLYQQYLKMNGSEPAYKTHNWAYGDSSIAIGSRNVAFGHSSLAIGTSSIARGNYSTALGTGTLAFGNSAVAVGNEVFVYNDAGVAVGNNIQSLAKGSIVYGYISYAGGEGSVAIGTRASAGVEVKGEHFNLIGSSHDRVVLEEMYNGNADDSRDKTYEKLSKLDTNKENLYKVKADQQDGTGEEKAKANGATGGVAIGYYVIANGENSLALGRQAYATGKSSVAMGPYAYAKDENTVAIGYAAKAIGKESFAIGSYSRADGKNSIALGIGSKVLNDAVNNNLNGENSLALGNETEVKMQNSVALGYKSTTNYFYKDDNKSAATLMGEDAIELPSYFPKGSSYKVDVSDADGVVSVGGWNKSGKVGFRRIVNAAPGALDSDVATVGQLKALYYVKKEGPMVYYTEEGGKQIKLVKDADGKFYKVNTDNGEPMKNSKEIPKENVLIGAKGANEVIEPTTKLANIGEKIKFGHLANGKIADNSDQAITGHQLKNVGDILGISINANNTKFDNPSFAAVKYVGETNGTQSNFKGVIDELITAVNKGYKFSDGNSRNSHKDTPFYLGSTLEIKAGDISSNGADTHLGKNLKTEFKSEFGNSKAVFTIGLKDDPEFKTVKVMTTPSDGKHAVNKEYVDGKLANVAAKFTVKGDSGSEYQLNKDNTELNIKGKSEPNTHQNIKTEVNTGSREVTLSLNSDLKNINSVGKDDHNKIAFNTNTTTIKLGGIDLSLNKTGDKVKISGVADGVADNDAVNFKQLEASKLHFLSVHKADKSKGNYNNDGAKAANSVAIGVDVEAQTGADSAVLVGHSLSTNVKNSVVVGSNINIEQGSNDNNRKDAVVAIGSGLKLKNAKSSIVIGAVDERSMADNSEANDAWRTVVEDAMWSVVLGNKTKIKNGDDVLALGNNITATGTSAGKSSGLVILGNRAKATDAKNSVVIGTSAESKAENAVVLGKGANVAANATGAVAIGESANVAAAAGDSIALGKNSMATAKKTVNVSQEVNVGKNSLKFDWQNGGVGADKSVVSVGNVGAERVITNVAAGSVQPGSTDAINGSQLDSVIRVFGKLGTDILGAKVDTNKTFKASTFAKLKDKDGADTNVTAPSTFKDAIDKNIAKINEGIVFAGNEKSFTRQLGATVTIKGDGTDLTSKAENNAITFTLNKANSIDKDNNTNDAKVVTAGAVKNFVTDKINNLSSTLQLEGDNTKNGTAQADPIGKVELKTQKLKLAGEADEIVTEVTKDQPTVNIKLAQKVKDKLNIITVGDNTANGDNSFALGKDSKRETKKTVLTGIKNVGGNGVTITWNNAGAGQDKEVVSVGDTGKERLITHVAAGEVRDGSTDAVNGGQLHSVIDVFAKLGFDILGAEKADNGKDGFKTPTFVKLKDKNGTDTNQVPATFKEAIDGLITTVNQGLMFAGDTGMEFTRQLGATVNIKGKEDTANNKHKNISTEAKNGTLEIALNENLKGIKSIENGENAKIALDGVNGSDKTITFTSGDKPETVTLKGSTLSGVSEINKEADKGALKLDNATATLESAKDKSKLELKDSEAKLESAKDNSNVALKANEATVTAGTDKGSLKLEADKATLESAKDKSKLELKDSEAKLESAKDNSNVALKANEATVTAGADKGTLKVEENKATLESAKDGSNLALDNTGATLSAGKGAGSIKVVNNGDKKIELSPENGSTVMLEKDAKNGGVQATGLSTIGKNDRNALVFNDTGNTAELKVGGNALIFTPTNGAGKAKTVKISNVADGKLENSSSEAITGGQLHALGVTHLGLTVDNKDNTKFEAPTFTAIKGSGKTDTPTTFKGAIDQLITAVNGGLTFKGNDDTNSSTKLQLGGTLTIDSSSAGSEKDITAKLEPSNGNDPKDAGKLTLTLNKATSVDKNDEKVITSKVVATELEKYTKTADLGNTYLKIDGSNIGGASGKQKFGSNVGIAEIKLTPDGEKSSTELVQAKAVIDYLKGTGEKSVKLSDSSTTQAIGEGSISIGHNAVSRNEGSIAMGYGANALNTGAVSIGQDSNVLGMSSIGIGRENTVRGNFSFAVGDNNVIEKEQNYVMGSDNKITGKQNISIGSRNEVEGSENIILGSNITADDEIHNAIVLGTGSLAKSDALSVGSMRHKRKIVFVADPTDNYDAANKKYVDDLTLTYKSNGEDKTKQTINLKNGALDFVKSENISVSVKADGKITHTLNNELKEIGSISATKDDKGAKITLSDGKNGKAKVELNDAKLTGLSDGNIDDESKDAVTGKQLADLASKLGVAVDKDKTKFTAPIFEYLSNVDGSFKEKNPTTLKGAIDEARAKLNEGLKFGGDVPTGTNNGTHYLGSTINIVRLGTPTGTGAVAPTSTDGYSGSNLITQYTYDKGNAKIEIGFKDAPIFSKVTLSQEQKYGDSKVGNEDVITKSYLEQALNSFKFNVAYDNKTVQIGRGDTLKFENGLNIQGSLKQEGTTQPNGATSANSTSAVTSTTAPTTAPTTVNTPSGSENGGAGTTVVSNGADSSNSGGSNSGSSDSTSNMVSSGGTNGGGSSSSADVASSGATSSTTPASTPTTTTSTTTAVVTIGTTEDLKNIKSISNGEKAKIALDKENNTIKFTSGATPEDVTLTGSTLSGVSEINKEEGKGALKLADSTATLESASGNSKVALENNEATITAGKNKGSLKLEADKVTLTSAKDGSSLALAKDSATVKVGDKATFTFNENGLDLGSKKITALASGLGLQDNASGSGDSDPNKSIIDNVLAGDPDKGKTEDKNKIANNAVNVKDLSTVAKALMDKGLTFVGNDKQDVHKKLGETLSIKGEGSVGATAADNIVVRAKDNGLEIGLTKNIRNIDTIAIAGTGDDSGKDIFIDAEGITTTAKLDDGTVLVNDQTASGNVLRNGTHQTEVKAGEVAIKDKSAQEIVSLKVADGENGQDGKGATLAFAKGTDGKSGTGTITGLKDLDATSDGTSAANKNYVDEKVSDLDSNRPFDFYIKEGKDYIKVIKGRDGKFYDPKDLEGAKYDVGSKKYVTQDGTTVETSLSAEDKVIIRAEPTTSPIGINNVASGLGITAIEESEKQSLTEAIKAKEEALTKQNEALLTAKKDVGKKQQTLEEKTNALSQITAERPTLLMQKADLEQQLKGLSANDPRRTTAQAALDKVKEALTQNDQKATEATKVVSEASAALDKAKIALADSVLKTHQAQQDLADAEEILRNRESGADRVKQLLAGNAGIDESNVATVNDLKAIAKAGLNFEGNDAKRLHKDLSETLTVKGEGEFNSTATAKGNIKVESDGSGLVVKLSDKLQNLTSVETKKDDQGRSAALLSQGVMVNNDTTKERSQLSENRLAFYENGALGLNLDGKSRALRMGEQEIIKVSERGEALVSDLNPYSSGQAIANKNYVDNKVNEASSRLGNLINTNNQDLQAGIAGANAAAGLPLVTIAGHSMLAVSAAGYRGQSAVAVGYSRSSDNGRVILKLQGNSNSRGHVAGSVGVGYLW